MRHRATPANPKDKPSLTPLEQRLHVQVMPADDVDKQGGKIFWFPKVLYLSLLSLMVAEFSICHSLSELAGHSTCLLVSLESSSQTRAVLYVTGMSSLALL
jgi:hypothetical protein